MIHRHWAVTGVAAGQLAAGAALLARPRPVTTRLTGAAPAAPPTWLVRALGLRMAVQGACEAMRPTPRVARWGAGVDTLHAATMVAVVIGSDRFRRAALWSAGIAAASAAALHLAARAPRR